VSDANLTVSFDLAEDLLPSDRDVIAAWAWQDCIDGSPFDTGHFADSWDVGFVGDELVAHNSAEYASYVIGLGYFDEAALMRSVQRSLRSLGLQYVEAEIEFDY